VSADKHASEYSTISYDAPAEWRARRVDTVQTSTIRKLKDQSLGVQFELNMDQVGANSKLGRRRADRSSKRPFV
jgi:hypothetical protein